MRNLKILQWSGAAFAVSGTVLLAWLGPWSKYGFVLYLISNFFWIRYGALAKVPGLVVQNVAFVGSSLFGIWMWFLPR